MVVFRTLILLLALALPAGAAEITLSEDRKTITVTGKIKEYDVYPFLDAAEKAKPGAVVRLNSTGGIAVDAFNMGRIIRLQGFATEVATRHKCYSACAYIWLAGSPRIMGKGARIGFHAPYNPATGKTHPEAKQRALSYVEAMGGSSAAADYLMIENPKGIRILTPARARKIGLSVTVR